MSTYFFSDLKLIILRIWQVEIHSAGFYVFVTCPYHVFWVLLYSLDNMMFLYHLVPTLPQPWNQLFLWEALVVFSENDIKDKNLDARYTDCCYRVFASWPFQQTELGNTCMYIYAYTYTQTNIHTNKYTHTHIYMYIYTCIIVAMPASRMAPNDPCLLAFTPWCTYNIV